ncbi:MAG: haloacid dehalogenase type II [Chloroflexota bacterium]|nr:haloacid dehalogenase type II [Chloroflexota bacterium]
MTERWATFDCYGTLIDWHGGITSVFRRLWPDLDSAHLLRLHHAIEPLVQAGRSLPYREVGARTLRAIAAIEALPLPSSDEYAFADSLPDWRVFPDVPDALRQLRQRGWRIAILSNTDPDLLDASVRQIGVRVDERITAAEAGSYKPAPGHWQRFFERTGADRAAHVHVAASPFHDLSAAERLGLTAVWINRTGERSDLARAAELSDMRELPQTLERLVSPPS